MGKYMLFFVLFFLTIIYYIIFLRKDKSIIKMEKQLYVSFASFKYTEIVVFIILAALYFIGYSYFKIYHHYLTTIVLFFLIAFLPELYLKAKREKLMKKIKVPFWVILLFIGLVVLVFTLEVYNLNGYRNPNYGWEYNSLYKNYQEAFRGALPMFAVAISCFYVAVRLFIDKRFHET